MRTMRALAAVALNSNDDTLAAVVGVLRAVAGERDGRRGSHLHG